MKTRYSNCLFLGPVLAILLFSPNFIWAEYWPLDGPGMKPGEENIEWIKLAYSEDPAELIKVYSHITDEDVAEYHKMLADRGIKFGDLIDKSKAHQVKDLLPDEMVEYCLERGLKFYVRETEPWRPTRRWLAATKVFSKDVKLGPNHVLENYYGGTPFPFPTKDDNPEDGFQIMWNLFYRPYGDVWDGYFQIVWIDAKKGVDRSHDISYTNYMCDSRMYEGKIVPENARKDTRAYFLTYGLSPYEIEGQWVLQIIKNEGSYNDMWAYIPGSRRVRRASSSANKDVFLGTDMINDDTFYGYNGQIPWFEKVNYIGEKILFGIAHGEKPALERDMNGVFTANFSDYEHPPFYLHQRDTWELRPMWVVEAIYGRDYPYGRRVIYIDSETKWLMYQVCYDQKGELWKFHHCGQRGYSKNKSPWYKKWFNEEIETPIKYEGVFEEGFIHGTFQNVLDVQSNHATYFPCSAIDPFADHVKPDFYSLGNLQKLSR